MGFELVLLCVLIFVFIVSFCGLLKKIKQSYDRERMISDRMTRRQEQRDRNRNSGESFSEIYVNSAYQSDLRNNDSAIFPAAPPPYSQNYADPPPKYEDVIKTEDIDVPATISPSQNETTNPEVPRVHSTSPPYTISTSPPYTIST